MKNILENAPSIPVVEEDKQTETPKNREIDRLEKPMEVILEKIIGNIERGEYNLIIGADASGRVPTLAFRKFVNYLYQKLGYQLPKTIFLAGAGMGLKNEKADRGFLKNKQEGAKEYIKRLNPERVLIVEDTIVRGSSIKFICDILSEGGVPFDVVSITSHTSEEEIKETKLYLGADNIYIGTTESLGIYGSRQLSGVVKDREQVFSRPYKQEFEEEDKKVNIQTSVNQARKDIDIVAKRVIDWYESRTKSSSR